MNGATQENLEHVKFIFEQKTGVPLSARRPLRRPLGRMAVLAAAIVCLLIATAFAANYFSEGAIVRFFQSGTIGVENSDYELSDTQIETVGGYTAYIDQSVVSMGTTLTLKSVTASISSGNLAAYFVLEIETPEGTLNGIDCDALAFESSVLRYEETSGMSSGGGGSIDMVLPDEQGRENVKTIVFSYLGTGVDFGNRGTPMALTFHNLCSQKTVNREQLEGGVPRSDLFHTVAEGAWTFELPLELFREGIELLDEPVAFTGYNYTLTTLELSPLCIAFTLGYPETENMEANSDPIFSFCSGMRIIMRDGSVIKPMGDSVWEGDAEYGENMMVLGGAVVGKTELLSAFYFDAPISINEVDCIQFTDGTEIKVGLAPLE